MRALARPVTVGLLSASTLTYEILLVRVFAIEEFHHFATMAIGVAMLGFGFSGTLLALVGEIRRKTAETLFRTAALLTAPALLVSVLLVNRVPLDATQLPWDPSQWPRLGLVYLLLALPFAAGAAAVLLGLTLEPERTGTIYGASFLGSGLGPILALLALGTLAPERALAVPALLAAAAAPLAAMVRPGARRRLAIVLGGLVILAAAAALLRPLWRLDITPYKALPQVEAYPDARRIAERSSPVGWVVAVRADAFRHAPGLSLAYRGPFPPQTALFVDAQIAGAGSRFSAEPGSRKLLDWLPTAMPYVLYGAPATVLVVGAGGGLEVANALAHGAREVTSLELVPALEELGWEAAGGPGTGEGRVRWIFGDARAWVAGADRSFDLIVLPPGGGLGTSAAGVHALNADFLHTVDAYADYLYHLEPEGTLAVTRWMTTPPRPGPRLILSLGSALRRLVPEETDLGLVVMRGWATATVLVRPSGFTAEQVKSLRRWCDTRRFDLDWYPGIRSPESRYNFMDEPVLYRAAEAVAAGDDRVDAFAADYPFAVAPAGDGRPYPHHYLQIDSLSSLMRSDRGAWLPFAEWGFIALLATLLQSAVIAGLLLLLPAALVSRGRARVGRIRAVGYFGLIGLAYLTAEIAAIQQLNLLLGHPVYSVATVLAAFLVASGLGSLVSDRRPAREGSGASLLIALLLVVAAFGSLAAVHALHSAPLAVRGVAAVALLAPLAFLMGMPFPLGLRHLVAGAAGGTAWAWAANGFASVIASPLAGLLALEAGTASVFLLAAGCYAVAALLHMKRRREPLGET